MAGVWSGFLTFGLVTLPVRLFSGARGERVSFHMLHDADHVRLKQQMICPKDGQVVGRDHTVRGYEYAKGEYVVIPEADIKAAAPPSERQLQIVEFCRADEVDPIWFESSYYLMPEAAGKRPYALLTRAMQESGYWAVAQLSMHNREYLSLLRPSHLSGLPESHKNSRRQGLLLHTLFYLDEIRVADGFGAAVEENQENYANRGLPRQTPNTLVTEIKLARQLIEGLAKPFDPANFVDHYRKNLEALVDAALKGRPAPASAQAPTPAPVVDLMAALKESLKHASTPAAKKPNGRTLAPKRGRRKAA